MNKLQLYDQMLYIASDKLADRVETFFRVFNPKIAKVEIKWANGVEYAIIKYVGLTIRLSEDKIEYLE